jgi:hypothetical protein
MNMQPRYLVTDTFDLRMLASLTVGITLKELSLEDVCDLIEQAEREQRMGLHGGWADGLRHPLATALVPHGPILLVANQVQTAQGAVMKWVQVEIVDRD